MKFRRFQNSKRPRATSGFLSMELALVLPILSIVLLGLFEFSLLFVARGAVVEASRAGARKASLPGVLAEDVEAEIDKILSPSLRQNVRVEMQLGERTGDLVAVTVQVPMPAASPDLLWPVGYSLAGRHLLSETRMIKE